MPGSHLCGYSQPRLRGEQQASATVKPLDFRAMKSSAVRNDTLRPSGGQGPKTPPSRLPFLKQYPTLRAHSRAELFANEMWYSRLEKFECSAPDNVTIDCN